MSARFRQHRADSSRRWRLRRGRVRALALSMSLCLEEFVRAYQHKISRDGERDAHSRSIARWFTFCVVVIRHRGSAEYKPERRNLCSQQVLIVGAHLCRSVQSTSTPKPIQVST